MHPVIRFLIVYTIFPWLLLSPQLEAQQALLVITDPTTRQPMFYYEASHALLIGISDYTNGWPDLPSVPQEIKAVEDLLIQQDFYVTTALNLPARKLKETIEQFIERHGFDQDARLVLFFSGHGYTRQNKGYIVPIDAPDPRMNAKDFLRQALSMDQILAWAQQIQSKHVLFLFDSCFSGAVFQTRSLPEYPPPITQATGLPVRQFITGGGMNDALPSKSVFTPAFIDALRFGWGDLNQDGYITGTELGLYLVQKVPMYVEQTPQFARIKDYDLAQGDIVFSVGGESRETALLTVLANVDDNTVFVDGKQYGSTRLEGLLPIGMHTVRVEKEGYLPFEATVYLQQPQTVYVTLEARPGQNREHAASTTPTFANTWTDPLTGMEFVWIPGGCYQMGCAAEKTLCEADERPVHEVCLDDFWLSAYEVTQAQWQQIMITDSASIQGEPKLPMTNVSYDDVQQFLMAFNRKAGADAYRLPTEAEWEYVARAGASTAYAFGDSDSRLAQYAWFKKNSEQRPHPVGQRQPNAYGVYDLYGNVWEWCQDRYDPTYFFISATTNPRGPDAGSDRVLRGGSWGYDARYCRSGYRFHQPPYFGGPDVGFRLVREP